MNVDKARAYNREKICIQEFHQLGDNVKVQRYTIPISTKKLSSEKVSHS